MNIKVIIFDVDGTVVNQHSKILASTKHALKKAKENGILLGIATGRGPSQLKNLDNELFDFFITYNGQLILTQDKEVLSAKPIDKTSLRKIISFAREKHYELSLGGSTSLTGSSLLRAGNSLLGRSLSAILPKKTSTIFKRGYQKIVRSWRNPKYEDSSAAREPVYQVTLAATIDEQKRLEKNFPELSFVRSNPYTVDIIPKGSSKLEGIKIVAQKYSFNLEEMIVFGDSWNDLEMIQAAGIGVAMGNSIEEIKNAADYTTLNNNQNGIEKALIHFEVI